MTPEPAPAKPTRTQRQILAIVRDNTVRRFVRESWNSRGSTVTFFWAPDLGGRPGPELSERTVSKMFDQGWLVSRQPDRKCTGFRDMVKWQTEATLHLSDAGLALL